MPWHLNILPLVKNDPGMYEPLYHHSDVTWALCISDHWKLNYLFSSMLKLDQIKQQSSKLLSLYGPVVSPHKGPAVWTTFPCDYAIMCVAYDWRPRKMGSQCCWKESCLGPSVMQNICLEEKAAWAGVMVISGEEICHPRNKSLALYT